jgi:hypothetical protein
VSFDRVRDELGFRPQHTVLEGVAEIHEALRNGLDDDVRTRTVGFYKNLLEAERLIRELSFRGRIF